MDIENLSDTIMKTGLCRYGSRQYRLFLCTSIFIPGTGDYEGPTEIANDREVRGYCIYFENMINKGNICAGSEYYEHFSDAIRAAEESPGFERWIN